ncbi:diaminopimelate epimerase [Actomonas aquatica]|uniref:Diaminopimelate epimerase n=1 Tax=Actomonas aquatica TaxID=2866162 RepID=A0ABZ1C8R6_9BACT|nr:diaminopimelate epimerase [Opitutus sp. WL0086]WRQ88093.1 diaminopimelate epimerase [Opitutus sp. WL0086]
MLFHKYHALGNDYIVIDPAEWPESSPPDAAAIRAICHRNFGVGSDGILWGPFPTEHTPYGLRIFNPDGSEAEKSGNGLRIFARYLWDTHQPESATLPISTLGGEVVATVHDGAARVTVDMGRVTFQSPKIPVTGPDREVINETLTAGDQEFTFCAASIGNPHCVVPLPEISADLAHRYGAAIENHPLFPQRINLQFLQVIDRRRIRIEIWERGAGYTLASGSSSSAAAAVAHRLGLVDDQLTVEMPGGEIEITIDPDYAVQLTGSVNRVADGTIDADLFTFPRLP